MSKSWILAAGLFSAGIAPAADGPLLSLSLLEQLPVVNVLAPATPAAPAPGSTLNFARPTNRQFTLDDGTWTIAAGEAIWRLKIRAEDAANLSLRLDQLQLPGTADIAFYDATGRLWHGPYTATEIQRHRQFWSPLVPGDGLLLEMRLPADQRAQTDLRIADVFYGDHDLNASSKSGSCNIDVACPAADSWTEAVRSTARITIGNQRLCSAVLLNNTAQDGDPLLLTANHCGVGTGEFSADSVRVYWNFEKSSCGGDPDGSLRENQGGSTLLASGEDADFTLLRLDQRPSPTFDVAYSGWDASGASSRGGVGVHHPSGDEKSISLYQLQPQRRRVSVDGAPVESWSVIWDRGVTEPGSSGSGLWNDQQRLIGQLSGGSSSCSDQDGADVYGRFDVAWDDNPAPSGQLKAWLDPTNSGLLTLDTLASARIGNAANNEEFLSLPADQNQLQLDVLRNDAGTPPLRLTDISQADGGQAMIRDNLVIFAWDEQASEAQITYQFIDRWGQPQSAQARLSRSLDAAPARGGSLGWPLLALLLAWAGRRRASR